jgi:hypothetical protein
MTDEVVELRAQVRAQDGLIARLEDRIAALEAAAEPTPPAPTEQPIIDGIDDGGDDGIDDGGLVLPDAVTDRRHLLSRAATAAAGAVVGGAALAVSQASPAAALPGVFDGNPAVLGAAVPTSGTGVTGNATSGKGVYGIVTTGQGVYGDATGGTGVYGRATTGRGVWARSTSGYGLHAESTTNWGAYAASTSNIALFAYSGSNDGVVAEAGGTGRGVYAVSAGGEAVEADPGLNGTHLVLTTSSNISPPPTSGVARAAGSVVRDSNGDLWLCVSGGTPGLWRRVSGVNTAGALTLLSAPVRIYDSRLGNPPAAGPKTPLANGASRTLDCTNNASGVPIGATGVLANVTVVNTSASGFLVAYKQGVSVPTASTINWFQSGTIVANTTVVACDTSARIACYVPPTSSTDFFVDIIGYTR